MKVIRYFRIGHMIRLHHHCLKLLLITCCNEFLSCNIHYSEKIMLLILFFIWRIFGSCRRYLLELHLLLLYHLLCYRKCYLSKCYSWERLESGALLQGNVNTMLMNLGPLFNCRWSHIYILVIRENVSRLYPFAVILHRILFSIRNNLY